MFCVVRFVIKSQILPRSVLLFSRGLNSTDDKANKHKLCPDDGSRNSQLNIIHASASKNLNSRGSAVPDNLFRL